MNFWIERKWEVIMYVVYEITFIEIINLDLDKNQRLYIVE